MKNKFITNLIINLILLFGFAMLAECSTIENYQLPLYCYTISDGRVNTYNGVNGSKIGWIDGTADLVIITKNVGNGWVYGSYPVRNGRKYAYFRLSDVIANVGFAAYGNVHPSGNAPVYNKVNKAKKFGTVYSTDNVTVVSQSGNMVQIIYPINNGYKMGWIEVAGSNNNSDNNRGASYSPSYPNGSIVSVANGWYRIYPMHATNKTLDISGAGTASGTNVQLWDWCDVPQQKFYIQSRGNGYYTIKSGNCDMYLDARVYAADYSPANGDNVWQYIYNGTNAQMWRFIDAGNGAVYIETKLKPGLSFDCAGGRANNGTNVQLWTRSNVLWHKWKLVRLNEQTAYKQWMGIAQRQVKAYTNSSLTATNGNEYVSQGDRVTVLNKQGNAYYVRYPVRNGTKDRWVSEDIFNSASSSSSSYTNKLNSLINQYNGKNRQNLITVLCSVKVLLQ